MFSSSNGPWIRLPYDIGFETLFIITSASRPQELDEAARRRLVKRLYIPLPDDDARKQIVYNLVKEQNCSLTDDDYCKIVHNTQGK